ncbi:MAG: PAS domain S-box protein, partial [Desulfocucumaceae bacterium]
MAVRGLGGKDKWVMIGQDLLQDGANIKVKGSLKIKDFMRHKPSIITLQATLKEAAEIIVSSKIDGVPIVDDKGHMVGLITKTLVLREMLAGTGPETPVSQIMITKVISTGPEEDVSRLITVNVGNLPVVQDGRVVGIVTLSDTIRAYFSSLITLREEMNTIIDSTHNGIFTVSEEGKVILINKAAEDFLGLRREDVVGQPVSKIFPQGQLLEVLETGKADFGRKIVYKDRVFISNQTPVVSNEKIIGAVAVFQDISELELISEELNYTKQMKEELDAIIESSFDGIHVTDGEGKTLHLNRAFSRIAGKARGELVGKSIQELVEEGVYSQSVTDMVLSRREAVTFSQKSKPGNTVMITANPVFNQQGSLFRVVTNVRDMTELNILKQQLEQAQNITRHLREKLDKYNLADKYVIRSQKSRDLVDLCIRLGQVDATVLIQGESGVGKEIAAQIIHSNSNRRSKPMISINCA